MFSITSLNIGLILYNGNKGNEKNGDFISLALVNGVPEFRFNLGGGVATVQADHPVSLNEWHTIKVIRYRKKGKLMKKTVTVSWTSIYTNSN